MRSIKEELINRIVVRKDTVVRSILGKPAAFYSITIAG